MAKPQVIALALILACSVSNLAATPSKPRAAPPQPEPVSIDFSLSPLEKDTPLVARSHSEVSLKISDPRSGTPLGGLRPKAWLQAVDTDGNASPQSCTEKIRSLASGSLTTRADVDMNRYWLLTLNSDKTVTFIDPQLAFSATKLESIVELPGVGADWVSSANQHFLYIAIPEQSVVAVVDTASRKLVKSIATGDGSRPTRLLMQPDGRYLWVGLDDRAEVVAIDPNGLSVAAHVATGKGRHTLAASADGQAVFVSNAEDDTITAIDTRSRQVAATIATGKTPLAMDYGTASHRLYAAELNGGQIKVIDPSTLKIAASIDVKPGIVALRFDPAGRFAFAVNQLDSSVTVIDSATQRVIGGTQVVKEPDQIAFTDRYAYVRGIASEKFSLIDLTAARKGELTSTEIQAGRQPPEADAGQLGVAPMIVPTPEGNSVMIANGPDREVYFYQEGMMAPMGTFSNYSRVPRGIMMLDQSLSEASPGVYQAHIRLPPAGQYSLAVLLDQPRATRCFDVTVAANPDGETASALAGTVTIARENAASPVKAGESQTLRFHLTDSAGKPWPTPFRNAGIVVLKPPGTWQKRGFLHPAGDGLYEWQTRLPNAGHYTVVITIPTHKVRWADSAAQHLTALPSQADGAVSTSNANSH